MGSSSKEKCDASTKKKLQSIHILVGKGPHNTCYKYQKKLVPIDGKRSNAYMDAINIDNIDLSAHWFAPKSIHHICLTMELTINNLLETYDEDNINLEEEHFARMQHYNSRSNPNFEEDVYIDDCFIIIEFI